MGTEAGDATEPNVAAQRTGGGQALHGVDVGGSHKLKDARILHIRQRWDDVERRTRATGIGGGRGSEPAAATAAAAAAGLVRQLSPTRAATDWHCPPARREERSRRQDAVGEAPGLGAD